MKKLIYTILTTFLFFSIVNISVASEWYMEKILDMAYWVEELKLKIYNLDPVYFTDQNSQNLYNNFRAADNTMREQIWTLYKAGQFDYYRMNGIIDEYNLFLYHTNRMFYYLSLKARIYDKQLDNAIANNYELSRSHYERVKFLLIPKPKDPEEDWCPISGLRPCVINLKY